MIAVLYLLLLFLGNSLGLNPDFSQNSKNGGHCKGVANTQKIFQVTINVPVVYMGLYKVDSPPSKSLCTTPYKQQVHKLFYVPAIDI